MRKSLSSSRGRAALATTAASLAVLKSLAAFGSSDVRSGDRLSFALTGARVIAAPGRVFDRGVVVVRGGVVEAVGAEGKVSIPSDARVYDLKGKIVHAAFVDPYVSAERLAGRKPRGPSDEEEPSEERTPPPRRSRGPAEHTLASVRADHRVIDTLSVVDRVSEAYRRLGYAVVAAAPQTGILSGRSAVVSLADGPISGRVLEAEGAQVISLEPERFDFGSFGRAGYVSGKHVYPSLVPAATNLGLVEISAARATVDFAEIGDVNPEARADVAMNFDSEILPVTRSAGVLVAGVTPTGGIVSGSGAAMKLDGWTREDAAIRAPAYITVTWPNLAIDRSPLARFSVRVQEKRRDEALAKLKDVFAEARAYGRAREAEAKAGVPRHDLDPRLEVPAIEGKIPVLVVADRLAQIRGALSWAKSENLRIVIGGGRDAWRGASELAAAGVPVVLDPVIGLPTRADEPYDTPHASPGILSKAGVRVAINEGDSQFARNLAHHASVATAYGMPREKALQAITLEPARILGIADRVGSLEPGKDATLFVSDRDVLDFRYNVLAAYVDGRPLDLSDRHKRLSERYRNRPKPGAK